MSWVAAGIGLGTAALGAYSASKSGGQTTTTAQTAGAGNNQYINTLVPNSSALPLYGYAAGNAQNLMQQYRPYFPGQTYVSPSDLTQQGINYGVQAQDAYRNAYDLYGQQAQGLIGAQGNAQNILGIGNANYGFLSNAADVANNPYVQAQLGQNARAVNTQLNEQWLPQIQSGAQRVNALGSDRQGLAQGVAAGKAADALSQANASTMLNAYGQGLSAQQNALGQTGIMAGNQGIPANMLGSAGNAYANAGAAGMTGVNNMLGLGQTVEGYQQAALNDQIARFNHPYDQAWQNMQNVYGAMDALSPIGQQWGNSANTSSSATNGLNPNYQSTWQGALGGAATGLGVASELKKQYPQWFSSGTK